ncbi:MAG: acetyl-CoA carboxylase [Halobacteriota archaeon]
MSTITIEAPMPGVFYRRPDPDEDVFVEEGDSVDDGDVVGLVGVMKNYHDIESPTSGTVTAIHAEEESEISAGDVLFEIEEA